MARDMREVLIAYEPLVRSEVTRKCRYIPHYVDRDDLLAAGRFGVFDAARRHLHAPDADFGRLIRQRIRGAIIDELRAQDYLSRRLRKERPSDALAYLEDLPQWLCDRIEPVDPAAFDLFAMLDQPGLSKPLRMAIDLLTSSERHVVNSVVLGDMPQQTLARRLGITPARVSQILHSATTRMRAALLAAGYKGAESL